jgi:hypothetical protein
MRTIALVPVAGLIAGAFACGSSNNQQGFGNPDDGGSSSSGGGSGGSSGGSGGSSGGTFGDASSSSSGGQMGPAIIYAHTDTELWTMDPTMNNKLTDIGPFSVGGGTTPTITDLAVDASGNVFVNSETAIYTAMLPPSGTGTVSLTIHTQLPSTSKFYALGFTPPGTLETNQSLIAGDSAGNLYYIPSSNTATPQLLGGFGGSWALSGDVVFFSNNGATLGLATIRTCNGSCTKTNDSLAEIDVAAMKANYTSGGSSMPLLKQVFGSGTGYGELFGIGAWGNNVYAFSRAYSGNSAQLVQVGMSGTGTPLMQFPTITSGWSGAGVTTTAPITVVVQ